MSPEETVALIEKAGGDTAFGRELGIDDKPWWQQRVNNWKRRGMPAKVVLENYEKIERIRKEPTT